MTAKQEHTPGQWYTKHGQINSLTSAHGCTIANCNATAKGISPAEVEANARLISAAPDMLATCVDMLAHWGMEIRTDEDREREQALLAAARAAIAKAEGTEA